MTSTWPEIDDFCRCDHPDHGPRASLGTCNDDGGQLGHHPRDAWIPLAMGVNLVGALTVCDPCLYACHQE